MREGSASSYWRPIPQLEKCQSGSQFKTQEVRDRNLDSAKKGVPAHKSRLSGAGEIEVTFAALVFWGVLVAVSRAWVARHHASQCRGGVSS
jgi:hypothetical protein